MIFKLSRGYTLVGLIIAVSLITVSLLAAAPMWSNIMKRHKEDELVFRMKMYATAIEEYKMKMGSYPTDLKQLIEGEPRFIRRLWKDPMTGKDEWKLIHQGYQNQQQGIPGLSNDNEDTDAGPKGGPIIGVSSTSNEESLAVYNNKTKYSEWVFTVKDLQRERSFIIYSIRNPQSPMPKRGAATGLEQNETIKYRLGLN